MSAAPANVSQPLLPDIRRLSNGLPVLLCSQPWSGRAGVCLRVNAGSHDEPLAYPGLAHFLEHMLFLDSSGYTASQRLMPFVQACAGHLNATTQARHTEFFFEVPADQLGGALARLLDMLTRPLLSESEQLREREVIHAEFAARCQDADTLLSAAMGQALPVGHRCGDFLAGNRDTLPVQEGGFQQALRSFHQRYYFAGNCQLSIVAPQGIEELYCLAQQYAAALPEKPVEERSAPSPMLPLRFHCARLFWENAPEAIHVGFVLDLPSTHADDAFRLLREWLLAEQAGGLLDELRSDGLCSGLEMRNVYAAQGQAQLVLSVTNASNPERVLALVNDWLAFMATHADLGQRLEHCRAVQTWQTVSLTPLELARQQAQAAVENGCCDVQAVRRLLEQMQDPQRQIVIRTQKDELPIWGGSGFPLRMVSDRLISVPRISKPWRLPEANPLLAVPDQDMPLNIPASLLWLDAADDPLSPIAHAAWRARLTFTAPLCSQRLRSLLDTCSRQLVRQAAQLGVQLHLNSDASSVEIRLHGHARLLPNVIGALMRKLANPSERCWQAAYETVSEAGVMPIRALLARINEIVEFAPQHDPDSARMRELYASMQVDALGIGFNADEQRGITALFATASKRRTDVGTAPLPSRVSWQQVSADGESALLLFCPQPDLSAETEAGWRLLAQLHQSSFYQRIRSELQLGYAVFCQYRQIKGQGGLLFGVQSPHLCASAILAHIQAFLSARTAWVEHLSGAELQDALVALQRQLQQHANHVESMAEQQWQIHLASLPSDHIERVISALENLSLASLCAAQHALTEGAGGRYILSNHEQSD
ncbi:pyrroloquinoline quinone biosynthesis protein PqqF [Ectopseudomonas mendocina]|uniref:Pyrroloquinoline quinone biosynthesis protein PqqF n=1 Tax=Ectopseudomonas mendocina TaxID=300 RepID=A0ABZ2RB27_ECTME